MRHKDAGGRVWCNRYTDEVNEGLDGSASRAREVIVVIQRKMNRVNGAQQVGWPTPNVWVEWFDRGGWWWPTSDDGIDDVALVEERPSRID
jgi:hypothetical protein